MQLNVAKCKIMHIDKNNPKRSFTIGEGTEEERLNTTKKERDLGVIVTDNGMPSQQAAGVSATANKMLGMIKNNLASSNDRIAKIIYPAFVRPHL